MMTQRRRLERQRRSARAARGDVGSTSPVQIVLATHSLASFGGSESYLLTVAEHLERLGHSVAIAAAAQGEAAERARDRGLSVPERPERLPEGPDAVIAQDHPSALAMAERYPAAPRLFVCHSALLDVGQPPAIGGVIGAAVAMSERVATRIRALAGAPAEIHRLRQPIDLDRFAPRGEIAARPRRALLLGNYLRGARREAVMGTLAEAGIEVDQAGRHGTATHEPEVAIAAADMVIGYGRSVLEGMACGRAAYVLDYNGGDGWVTPETWAAHEARAFAGRATDDVVDARRLRTDLDRYDPAMGTANRDLAVLHHDARDHARALVEIGRGLGAANPPPAPLAELARLVRIAWRAEGRAADLARQLDEARLAQDAQIAERWTRIHGAEAQTAASAAAAADAREETADLRGQRRVRLANRLAAPFDRRRARRD